MSMEIQAPAMASKNVRRRLVLFPAPLQGHMTPMLHLAKILHSKGFSITMIYTNFNSPDCSIYPEYTFRAIDDGLPPEVKNATPDIVNLPILTANCVEPFRDCLAQLSEESIASKEPVSCLIIDALWSYTQVVTDKFKLPMIVLWTGNLSCCITYLKLPVFREKGYFDVADKGASQLEDSVPEYSTLKLKDIPKILAHNHKAIFEILMNMMDELKAAPAIIWNSCKELEQPELATIIENFPVKNFLIGPVHKYSSHFSSSLFPQDLSCITWLDSQLPKSVIYVSFGSIVCISEAEFLEMAWGLANCMQPFLWVIRPRLVYDSEWIELLPNGFLESLGGRGHVTKWAPQQEVLAHPATGGFWTHNGWNSTLESICEGVPMICYHGIFDQPINARYATDVWKVGVELDNGLKREEITRTIRRIMADKEGQAIRDRSTCLKKTVNQSVKQGGSSHESFESLADYILSLQ